MTRESCLFVCNQCLIFIIQQALRGKVWSRDLSCTKSLFIIFSSFFNWHWVTSDRRQKWSTTTPPPPQHLLEALKSILRGFLQRVKLLMLNGMLDSACCLLITLQLLHCFASLSAPIRNTFFSFLQLVCPTVVFKMSLQHIFYGEASLWLIRGWCRWTGAGRCKILTCQLIFCNQEYK